MSVIGPLIKPIKKLLPHGRQARTVRAGLYAGIRLFLDMQSEMQIFAGLYEQETFADLRRLAQGCRGMIDLGAAKGELSIYFLRRSGIERVVAAEPAPEELALFKLNLRLNGLAEDARLHLHAGFAGRGPEPAWRTLDQLAENIPSPVFIKMDIEGAEASALASGSRLLSAVDCRLLIETHGVDAEASCIELLESAGYTVKIVAQAWWRAVVPEHRGDIPHNRWMFAWRAESMAKTKK